jgi:two-component system, LytTR family, sensor kinase
VAIPGAVYTMSNVPPPDAGELLNLVGFVTGAALYSMLLGLVLRTRSAPVGGVAPTAPHRLPLATATLGLVWNLGELCAYTLTHAGRDTAAQAVSALSFAALGLLASVVVHSVGRHVRGGRGLILLAYAGSVVAAILHTSALVLGAPAYSAIAFGLLTVCFGALIVPLALLTRAEPHGPRALWMLALALFAVSASHVGRLHHGGTSWPIELVGHHAAIPLAFAMLYQDYRFALADLFLKHALTLLATVALAFGGYSLVSALPNPGTLTVALLLGLWILTAVVYPRLQRTISRFVDVVLLGRGNYERLGEAFQAGLAGEETVEGVLASACRALRAALHVGGATWIEEGAALPRGSAAGRVPVLTTDRPAFTLLLGGLEPGRRLLSDDVAFAERVAAAAGRRIDAIRFETERFERRLREAETLKLAAQAELRALRAQVNPHFLFNALTTIGYLIDADPRRALQTLMRLTSLLRAVLRADGDLVPLGREIELVEHYLDIERERFEERLRVSIDVPARVRHIRVPSLIVQPLVENAVKHGIARSADGGAIEIRGGVAVGRNGEPRLSIVVRNSGLPLRATRRGVDADRRGAGSSAATDGVTTDSIVPGGDERVGLTNVEQRLLRHFGDGACLSLQTDPDGWTRATVEIPVAALDRLPPNQNAGDPSRPAGLRAHG